MYVCMYVWAEYTHLIACNVEWKLSIRRNAFLGSFGVENQNWSSKKVSFEKEIQKPPALERKPKTCSWSQKVNFEKKSTCENEKPPTGARLPQDSSPRRGCPSRSPSALLPIIHVGQGLRISKIFHTSKILCGKGACQECKRYKKSLWIQLLTLSFLSLPAQRRTPKTTIPTTKLYAAITLVGKISRCWEIFPKMSKSFPPCTHCVHSKHLHCCVWVALVETTLKCCHLWISPLLICTFMKMGTAIIPTIPPAPCTGIASTGSSILRTMSIPERKR